MLTLERRLRTKDNNTRLRVSIPSLSPPCHTLALWPGPSVIAKVNSETSGILDNPSLQSIYSVKNVGDLSVYNVNNYL